MPWVMGRPAHPDNPAMRALYCVPVLFSLLLLACSPALNWRDVQLEGSALNALLPCKPDQADRSFALGADTVDIHMMGCEAGQAMFTLARLPLGAAPAARMETWRTAQLAAIRAGNPLSAPIKVAGADSVANGPLKLTAVGTDAQGQPIEMQAVYFTRDAQGFQAMILGAHITADMAENFFSGLRLP